MVCDKVFSFVCVCVAIQLSQHHLLNCLGTFVRIQLTVNISLFWEFQFGCMDLCACPYARTMLSRYDDFIITMELGSVSPPTVIFFFRVV